MDIVRAALEREWMNARRVETIEKLYDAYRQGYEIIVETTPDAGMPAGTADATK